MTDVCLSLLNSNACPGFSQHKFNTSITSFYNETRKDVAILDANIQNFVDVTSIDQIVSEFNCNKEDVVGRKHLRTFTCGVLIKNSAGCNLKTTTNICNNVCQEYIDSVLNILEKCKPSPDQRQSLETYCQKNNFMSSTNCITAEMNEETKIGASSSGWRNEYIALIVGGIAVLILIILVVLRSGCCQKKNKATSNANKSPVNNTVLPYNNAPVDVASSYRSSLSSSYETNLRNSSVNRRTTSTTNSTISDVSDNHLVSILKQSKHHYKCIREYTPELDDEIEMIVGDIIALSHKYDDGWAYGLNLNTGGVGVMPLSYVVPTNKTHDVKPRESVYGNKKRLDKIQKMRSTYATSESNEGFSTYSSSAYTTNTNNIDSVYTNTTYHPPHERESTYTDGTGYTVDSNFTMDSDLSKTINKDMNILKNKR